MEIIECKVNHLENPVGYKLGSPVFCWKVKDAEGKRQEAARVRIAYEKDMKECIVDTGYEESLNSLAFEPGIPLKPRTGYYWDVEVRSETGESALSEVQYFETGKMSEGWNAKWITCDGKTERHPVFGKELGTEKKVKRARLYICGLGLYEVLIDGQKAGEEFLAPGCNDYNSWIQYQTYDITSYLTEKNAGNSGRLEVLLGNGWYKGRFGCDSTRTDGYYGNEWKLLAEIRIEYEDGTESVIGTDESWQVKRGSILFSNIYDGEHRDDTIPVMEEGYAVPAEAPAGKLTERMSTPVTVHEVIKPVELIVTPSGEQILDMGQNFAGIFRLRVKEAAGTIIHLQFGEVLQNGNFYRDNLRSARAEYIYISNGEETVLVPHFTFYGYRYVKVEGISGLKTEDFEGLALYSRLGKTGDMTTGNSLVNQLISNTRWGLKSNFVDVPADCPQRDERMGWTGDAQVFSPTACYLEDCYAFYAKYQYDMAREQEMLGGKVPQVVPSFQYKDTSSVWGDAACIIPWNLYRFYGDKKILEEQFESMKSWVDYITRVDAGSEHKAWGEAFHYGDWLALDNKMGGEDQVMGATDADFIAYVYYMESAMIVSKAAGILGAETEKQQYMALSEELRAFIAEEYFSKNGRCCIGTQTALILSLKYHLTANEEWSRKRLAQLFRKNMDKLETGFVGTPLMCPVLSENGMSSLAYRLLLNEEYPGWLYEINLGATTVWERWNSVLEDGSISSTGMNSLNHYSYGSIVEWLFAYSAGIRQAEGSTGFKKAQIAPEVDWNLRKMDAYYNSASGVYRCRWNIIDETHIEIGVTVPFGCEAEVVLPLAKKELFKTKDNPMFESVKAGICHLSAGSYSVVYETAGSMRKIYSCDMAFGELISYKPAREILLRNVPQTDMVPTLYYDRPARDIFMEFAGAAGVPDKDTVQAMLGQIDSLLAQVE